MQSEPDASAVGSRNSATRLSKVVLRNPTGPENLPLSIQAKASFLVVFADLRGHRSPPRLRTFRKLICPRGGRIWPHSMIASRYGRRRISAPNKLCQERHPHGKTDRGQSPKL